MASGSPSLPVLMIGLNHKAAPVEVRERLAISAEHIPVVLKELLSKNSWDAAGGIQEAVLLSTCNRSECYVCTANGAQAETWLLDTLACCARLPAGQLQRMVYIRQGEPAVEHLMRVAAGMDSLVLGENEILGQVRAAAELAQAAGATGPILSALFRCAIQAGKRARAETEIGSGNISVASVVVELAEQMFGSLKDRTALLIGAGKISAITARALVKAGLRCVMVANRSFDRAQKLAASLGGPPGAVAVHFDVIGDCLTQDANADIVICSTGAPHIVLHAEAVEAAQVCRKGRPLLVADLAVPRDADPQIADIPGVKLINIDDLESIVQTNHVPAAAVCQAVEEIVQQELAGFRQWCEARRCAPILQALHHKAERIYQAEVDQTLRRLGDLTPHQECLVQAMGKAIAGKLLHEPTVRLRELAPDEELSTYLDLVQDLWHLRIGNP